jgi:membrane protein implicated in regulation of membrane protease activity
MWYFARLLLVATVVLTAVAMLFSGVPDRQVTGGLLLVSCLALCVGLDWYSAWANERHVRRRPELLKNSSIGAVVRAHGGFRLADRGMAVGVVRLHGEQWRARCDGIYVPADGEILTISGREGLTLTVRPWQFRGQVQPGR